MKELTATFNSLLQDKRVRSEQSKYENINRQRTTIMNKYRRIYQEFLDLEAGLQSAKQWYSEMKDTVDSLDKNVETFVNNRRSEGAQLLNHIEQERAANASGQADRERERLRGLMERMSMDPSTSPSSNRPPRTGSAGGYQNPSPTTRYPATNFAGQYQVSAPQQPSHTMTQSHSSLSSYTPPNNSQFAPPPQKRHPPDIYIANKHASAIPQGAYNPSTYNPRENTNQLFSAPANQTHFGQMSPPPTQTQFTHMSPPPTQTRFDPNSYGRQPKSPMPNQHFNVPTGYVPPPPPPGPPPLGPQQTFPGQTEYGQQQQRQSSQQGGDPWAGLNAWR
jgi:hypothetical protein